MSNKYYETAHAAVVRLGNEFAMVDPDDLKSRRIWTLHGNHHSWPQILTLNRLDSESDEHKDHIHDTFKSFIRRPTGATQCHCHYFAGINSIRIP